MLIVVVERNKNTVFLKDIGLGGLKTSEYVDAIRDTTRRFCPPFHFMVTNTKLVAKESAEHMHVQIPINAFVRTLLN